MLVLNDFSAVLQVLIAFYAVYVVEGERMLDTFIFSKVKEDLLSLKDEANRQYNDSRKAFDDIKMKSKRIDKTKLTKPQADLVKTSLTGAEQDVQMRKSFKDLLDSLSGKFLGITFFLVLSVDIVLLSFILMVIGVLDCKPFFCVDVMAGTLILVTLLLEVHCFLYRFCTKIRDVKRYAPKSLGHIVIILLVCSFLIVANQSKVELFLPKLDINCYMSLFAIVSLLPPILEVSTNYFAVKKMKRALKENDEIRTFALDWFKRDIELYMEMYGKEDK